MKTFIIIIIIVIDIIFEEISRKFDGRFLRRSLVL